MSQTTRISIPPWLTHSHSRENLPSFPIFSFPLSSCSHQGLAVPKVKCRIFTLFRRLQSSGASDPAAFPCTTCRSPSTNSRGQSPLYLVGNLLQPNPFDGPANSLRRPSSSSKAAATAPGSPSSPAPPARSLLEPPLLSAIPDPTPGRRDPRMGYGSKAGQAAKYG